MSGNTNDTDAIYKTIQQIKRRALEQSSASTTMTDDNIAPGQKTLPGRVSVTGKVRASKYSKPLNASERKSEMRAVIRKLIYGELSQGQALQALRIQVLGLRQDAYAGMVRVSRKTLSEIENDKGNYTADIINKVFKPFGLKVGLMPVSPSLLKEIIATIV
ncbi:transcriptional regulator [Pectobacteriaceae bacterium CE70]|nr:transcriptional regulator [Pectobacteriaceae bacterium C52]WJV66008.1 transcriptional regulator [Pectobacteriaceae bacterium CE70]WJY10026.1 transcriptional regulator [Pectobacteriaceae bacterium C80]